jgi:hypothetical protein
LLEVNVMAKEVSQTTLNQEAEGRISSPAGVEDIWSSEGFPIYRLPRDALSMGASFGNSHCWITTKGQGDIQGFFSTDLGRIVMGAMLVRFSGLGATPLLIKQAAGQPHNELMQLLPEEEGNVVLHPAYQEQSYLLQGGLQVRQMTFVPKFAHAHECAVDHKDLAVAYQRLVVSNTGAERRLLRILGFAHMRGQTEPDIQAEYDEGLGILLAHNASHPDWVRFFAATIKPTAYETSADAFQVYRLLRMSALGNHAHASGGYVLGALQVDLPLEPGQAREVSFIQGFSVNGRKGAIDTCQQARDPAQALKKTIAFYKDALDASQIITPDPVIDKGTFWAKVNMLRVMADYPTGPAFTNDPSRSSAVVGRDAFWMVHGSDYLRPEFSCDLLRSFAKRQDDSGEILEFYDAVTGKGELDGMNINDNTPLFILALHHHYRTTGHRKCLEELYPAAVKAAGCILSQRNEKGLVWCTATGEDVRGIIGWRNIIPNYRISGAVTEVNAECAAALRHAGQLAQTLGHRQEAENFLSESRKLKAAINEHLLDQRTGFYYLNIDVDGSIRTDVTADEVFPVLWDIAPPEVAYNIVRRIHGSDFFTEAGVRTASKLSAEYDPGSNWGLLGGVWPGMTWWYAFAASRYYPGAMALALHASFAHYSQAPALHNTVPGQFSEWFDGDSLVNRGMRLSPWEAPRYLWAAVEGACGILERPHPELPRVSPHLPTDWMWIAARNIPLGGRSFSYFAAALRSPNGDGATSLNPKVHLFTVGDVEPGEGMEAETFVTDVSDRIRVYDTRLRAVALERPGEIVVLLANASTRMATGAVDLEALLGDHLEGDLDVYNSELGTWLKLPNRSTEDLKRLGVAIEGKGFRIARISFSASDRSLD